MADFETTAKADVDLSAVQYHILRNTGARTTNIASYNAGENGAGILQNKPKADEHATIRFGGRSFVVAGAAITANAYFTTNGSGRAIAASSGQFVYGRTLETAAADGDKVECVVNIPWFWK